MKIPALGEVFFWNSTSSLYPWKFKLPGTLCKPQGYHPESYSLAENYLGQKCSTVDYRCKQLWDVLTFGALTICMEFLSGFLGQMERFISSVKNGSKYDAVPFVKNDPVELGRLGRLVPRFTKSSTVDERMARVRFLQMVQLILVISGETKKEEYLRRHSFYSRKFSPGWTVPFDISSEQMVSVPNFVHSLSSSIDNSCVFLLPFLREFQ